MSLTWAMGHGPWHLHVCQRLSPCRLLMSFRSGNAERLCEKHLQLEEASHELHIVHMHVDKLDQDHDQPDLPSIIPTANPKAPLAALMVIDAANGAFGFAVGPIAVSDKHMFCSSWQVPSGHCTSRQHPQPGRRRAHKRIQLTQGAAHAASCRLWSCRQPYKCRGYR